MSAGSPGEQIYEAHFAAPENSCVVLAQGGHGAAGRAELAGVAARQVQAVVGAFDDGDLAAQAFQSRGQQAVSVVLPEFLKPVMPMARIRFLPLQMPWTRQ